ncbi:MAG: polysaccharide biosynthesis/export family protein [Phormidesmis sp.]
MKNRCLQIAGYLAGSFLIAVNPAVAADALLAQASSLPQGNPQSDGLPSLDNSDAVEMPSPDASLSPADTAQADRKDAIADDGFLEPTVDVNVAPRFPRDLIPTNTPVSPSQLSNDFNGYYLGPGDSIFISVQRYPELSFQATLDIQGNVVLPIEGATSLKGLTLAQARSKILSIYSRYVTFESDSNREVSLTLVAQRSVEVTILGAVQRPGFYPLADPSVATALLTAGGATRTSDLRAIQIQRRIPTDNGIVEQRVNVDLFTPLKEGSALPDVRLEDGDVMVIAELEPDDFNGYDRNLVARSTLAQPIINIRFLNYAGGRGGLGTLNLNNGSTFLDAVSLLGVNPDAANLRDVALIRYDPETGRAVTVSVDAKMAIRGDITQNPTLEDSDVIVVGRNVIGRLSFALQTVTRPFRDVGGFLDFFDDLVDDDLFRN